MLGGNMYAIIETGGKQYKVQPGDVIHVEKLSEEKGSKFKFDKILLVSDGSDTHVGAPSVEQYVVECELLGEASGPKIDSLRYKPTQYKHFGHRQHYSEVKITGISKKK
jgi:large subunit ribosomal protein L21